VACDAVINRELLAVAERGGGDAPALGAFFEDYYSPRESPWFLLRPPPGWPHSPDWDASRDCPEVQREIHRRLYAAECGPAPVPSSESQEHPFARHTVLYGEIVAALQASGSAPDSILARLLGGHGSTPRE